MGERMDRMGNESKDIAMFWRKKAAYWAQIALVLQQKKVEKTEKRREEEEKYKGMKEEEMDKDAGVEHQEKSEGELKRGEVKDNSMETENELEVMKKVKDKNEDEANKNCEVRDAEDLVDEEVVKEFVEEDVAEGELGNDGGTTQYLEEVVAIVMETENELEVRNRVKDRVIEVIEVCDEGEAANDEADCVTDKNDPVDVKTDLEPEPENQPLDQEPPKKRLRTELKEEDPGSREGASKGGLTREWLDMLFYDSEEDRDEGFDEDEEEQRQLGVGEDAEETGRGARIESLCRDWESWDEKGQGGGEGTHWGHGGVT